MSSMTLYGALNSGHSYKVRLAMMLAGMVHRYEQIDIAVPRAERPEPFRSLAKFGEVPVLVDAGEALVQSNACLLYLADRHGVLGWRDEAEHNTITQWLFWEANRIGRSYPNLRWFRRFNRTGGPGLVDWLEQTAMSDLDRMDTEFSTRSFLLGRPTIADVSLAGYLLYDDDMGLDMARWPHVMRWLDRLRALPGWQHPYQAMAA